LNAIAKNIRYETTDLNRLWTRAQVQKMKERQTFDSQEEREQYELYSCIQDILQRHDGKFIFVDLHTTSSETIPFVTISDSLANREFVMHLNVPIILGIEEYLEGPLLTYINEFGHVALGFEAGQHEDPKAVTNCEAFIWKVLQNVGALPQNSTVVEAIYKRLDTDDFTKTHFYHISDRYKLQADEEFTMKSGFKNFDTIQKSQQLATSNQQMVTARFSGKIFMPLYQKQGDDGFFIITKVSFFWLQLSKIIRTWNLHHVLRILPGVRQDVGNAHALFVNPRIAKFLTTKIFHLFGYRKKVLKVDKWYFIKRD
jgi:succinylglutamate desuccinylase